MSRQRGDPGVHRGLRARPAGAVSPGNRLSAGLAGVPLLQAGRGLPGFQSPGGALGRGQRVRLRGHPRRSQGGIRLSARQAAEPGPARPGRSRPGRRHAGRPFPVLSRHRGMAATQIRPVQRPAAPLEDRRHGLRRTRKGTLGQRLHVSAHPVDRFRFPRSARVLRRGVPQAVYHALVGHGGILGQGAAQTQSRPGRRAARAVPCPSLRPGRRNHGHPDRSIRISRTR